MTIAEDLRRMETLSPNWHSCGCVPPNDVAIDLAREVIQAAKGTIDPSYVSPSTAESVIVAFERGWRYADIECFNDGTIMAIVSLRSGKQSIWDIVTPLDLENAISRIAKFIYGEIEVSADQ